MILAAENKDEKKKEVERDLKTKKELGIDTSSLYLKEDDSPRIQPEAQSNIHGYI